jgi:tyrosine-protein kinase Etk/Wzc
MRNAMNGESLRKETDLEEEDTQLSLLDLANTIVRRRRMIIAATATIAVAALLISLASLLLPANTSFMPNLYKPSASMLVNSDDSSGISSMLSSSGLSSLAGLAGVSGGTSYGQLSVYIAKSNMVLDALIDKFALTARYKVKKSPKTDTRKALLKHYSAAYDDKTGILTISFEDRDPEMARDLVNYAVSLIDQRFTLIGGNRNLTKKEQLEQKLSDIQAQMSEIENEIQAFQKKHGVLTVESAATEQVSTMAQVRSELIMKDMEIKTYGDMSKVQDPALMRLKAERDNLSKLLDQLEQGSNKNEKILPSQRELPALAIEFGHLQRDLAVQEKVFELLTQQYELTKLQISGSDPIIQVLEPAEAPDKKSGPSRGMICVVATLAAFFLSILAAFVIEAVENVKKDPEAMAKLKGSKE